MFAEYNRKKAFKGLCRKVPDVSLVKEIHKLAPSALKERNSHYIHYGYHVSYYGEKSKELKVVNNFNDACYARLTGQIFKARLYVNQHERWKKNDPYLLLLMDWFDFIMKRSHFKDAFFKASRKEWMRDGIGLNCNKSISYVMASITAFREGWEFPERIRTWNTFKQKGFDEHEAFVLSYFFTTTMGELRYQAAGGGHSALSGFTMSIQAAKDFISGKFLEKDKGIPMCEGREAWAVHALTSPGSEDAPSLSNWFKKKGKVINKGGWDERVNIKVDDHLLNEIKELFRGKA